METKICCLCNQDKLIEEFAHKKDKRQSRCKECFSIYTRNHYQNNKDSYKLKAIIHNNEYRLRNLQFIIDFFKTHPCVDCQETDPVVLEFDHLRDKKHNVSRLTSGSFEKLISEIEKCEVRCANCHRKKTAKQFNYYKGIKL